VILIQKSRLLYGAIFRSVMRVISLSYSQLNQLYYSLSLYSIVHLKMCSENIDFSLVDRTRTKRLKMGSTTALYLALCVACSTISIAIAATEVLWESERARERGRKEER
jgi:hypothetical protein